MTHGQIGYAKEVHIVENSVNIFLVGGAVRDELLGKPVKERDFVVVGGTEALMRAQGFQKVGKDFPVFLHPHTHEEYALARTERKIGEGHRGFSCFFDPSTTLEEDLARRDLTINAIAKTETGVLIDPYGGQADLQHQLLRHVSEAFKEDPLRVFRVARFQAQLPDFSIHPETEALMHAMARSGELRSLSPERIYRELKKSLTTTAPWKFFEVLQRIGALDEILPHADLKTMTQYLATTEVADERLFAIGYRQPPETRLAFSRLPLTRSEQHLLRHQASCADLADTPSPSQWQQSIHRLDALRRRELAHTAFSALTAFHGYDFLGPWQRICDAWSKVRCPDALKDSPGEIIRNFYDAELTRILKEVLSSSERA